MADLTLVQFPKEPSALDITAVDVAASAAGDAFVNVARVGFWVTNTSGVNRTVTFNAQSECNFGVIHDAAVVVPNGFSDFIAHRLESARFNDANNKVQVTYSSEVGLTVAAVVFAE